MRGRAQFGLDVGRRSVQLLRWTVDGVTAAERQVDSSLTGAERRAALVAAIREVAAELQARPGQLVHAAVPRAEAIVRRAVLPPVDEAELASLVTFQAAKELPFDLDEVELTWGRLTQPDEPGSQELLFAAVRRAVLDELRAVIAEAGLMPGRLEVSTQAAARTAGLVGGADGREVLLVEVGHATCDVIVLRDGRLVFSRSASAGCARAEDKAGLDRLGNEVLRSLVASRADDKGGLALPDGERTIREGPPDALLLAGGGAGRDDVRALLEDVVGLSPVVLDGLESGDASRGARFVVARGLADPRPVPGVPDLDLAHLARAAGTRASRNRVVAGAAAAALGLLVLVAGGRLLVARRAAAVEALEAERADLGPDVARAEALEAELEVARGWTARKGLELEVLLAVSRALPDDEAYLTRLRWAEGQELRLSGRAKEWEAVGRLLTRLEREPLVEKATFDDIRLPSERDALGVTFSGVAKIKAPEARP